ncbi:hypothetical protein ACJX0J_039262 [Zea mays]
MKYILEKQKIARSNPTTFHLPFASVVQWLREACQPARYLSVFAIWGVNADSTFMETSVSSTLNFTCINQGKEEEYHLLAAALGLALLCLSGIIVDPVYGKCEYTKDFMVIEKLVELLHASELIVSLKHLQRTK